MAGSTDLFTGTDSIHGANLWQVDRNPLSHVDINTTWVPDPQGLGVPEQESMTSSRSVARAILGVPSGFRVTLANITTYFGNVEEFLGKLNPLDLNFSALAAAKNFVRTRLHPTHMLAPVVPGPSDSAGVVGVVPLENLPLAAIADALGVSDLAARLERLEAGQ